MGLKLFNTLSRSVQEFAPLDPAGIKAGMYCCGPTVYDFAHIGNWRTFVFGDLVRRWLEFKGFQVTHVMNITDVDDKIIKAVRETKTSLVEFTRRYEAAFLDDLKILGCRPPHHLPRATGHIAEIISLVEQLVARGVAYQAPDGSVYFSIQKYRGAGGCYGQLLKLNADAAPNVSARLGVRGIPAMFLFRNGAVLAQTAGAMDADAIVRWTRAHLGSHPS